MDVKKPHAADLYVQNETGSNVRESMLMGQLALYERNLHGANH